MATNLEFIKRVSDIDVTSLEATDVFSDKYDNYYVVVDFKRSGTNAAESNKVTFLDSSGTEITTANAYGYAAQQINIGGASNTERRTSNANNLTWMSYDNDGYMNLHIYNPFSSSVSTFVNTNSSGSNYGWLGCGQLETATSCTGIKITFNGTGQYDDIVMSVYGVK